MTRDDLIEELAAIEHQRWSDWQRYQHGLCRRGPIDNCIGAGFGYPSLTIPSASVAHWERQIATPYTDLSEAEKQSDREQVMRYWPLIVDFVAAWLDDVTHQGTAQPARLRERWREETSA